MKFNDEELKALETGVVPGDVNQTLDNWKPVVVTHLRRIAEIAKVIAKQASIGVGDLVIGRVFKRNFYGKVVRLGMSTDGTQTPTVVIYGGYLTDSQWSSYKTNRERCEAPDREHLQEFEFWAKYVVTADAVDAKDNIAPPGPVSPVSPPAPPRTEMIEDE